MIRLPVRTSAIARLLAASAPLLGMIGSADKDEVVLNGGHVSLVAGGNAIKRLWPKLTDWLGKRSI